MVMATAAEKFWMKSSLKSFAARMLSSATTSCPAPMVCLTGTPYDTLHGVIGLKEGTSGSLKDFGISYEQIDLLPDGGVNYDAIPEAVKGAKVAYIQRSRGYSLRPSLFVEDIEKMVKLVRQTNPDAIIMVDNCYGELVPSSRIRAAVSLQPAVISQARQNTSICVLRD